MIEVKAPVDGVVEPTAPLKLVAIKVVKAPVEGVVEPIAPGIAQVLPT